MCYIFFMNPILALIIANIIWGAASPIFKFSLGSIPSFLLAFIRFFFAAWLFYPFVNIRKIKELNRKDWVEIFIAASFGIFVNIIFFFWGVKRTESINVPVIASAGPLFLFFFSIIFLHEKPRFKTLVGMIVSFIGVLIIIIMPLLVAHDGFRIGEIEGNLMIVIATIGSIIQPLSLKNVLKKIDAFTASFLTFLSASVLFLPGAVIDMQNWSFSQLTTPGWVGIIFGVFLSSFTAYALYLYGLSKISAQETGVFSYIDPVIAIIIAYPLLHEIPDVFFILGSVLIFGGIWIAENRLHWHPFHKIKAY